MISPLLQLRLYPPGCEGECLDGLPNKSVTVNSNNITSEANDARSDFCQIYDVNYAGVEDKFANSILHINQFKMLGISDKVDTEIYNA